MEFTVRQDMQLAKALIVFCDSICSLDEDSSMPKHVLES